MGSTHKDEMCNFYMMYYADRNTNKGRKGEDWLPQCFGVASSVNVLSTVGQVSFTVTGSSTFCCFFTRQLQNYSDRILLLIELESKKRKIHERVVDVVVCVLLELVVWNFSGSSFFKCDDKCHDRCC